MSPISHTFPYLLICFFSFSCYNWSAWCTCPSLENTNDRECEQKMIVFTRVYTVYEGLYNIIIVSGYILLVDGRYGYNELKSRDPPLTGFPSTQIAFFRMDLLLSGCPGSPSNPLALALVQQWGAAEIHGHLCWHLFFSRNWLRRVETGTITPKFWRLWCTYYTVLYRSLIRYWSSAAYCCIICTTQKDRFDRFSCLEQQLCNPTWVR